MGLPVSTTRIRVAKLSVRPAPWTTRALLNVISRSAYNFFIRLMRDLDADPTHGNDQQ